jgi:hypothetical protein
MIVVLILLGGLFRLNISLNIGIHLRNILQYNTDIYIYLRFRSKLIIAYTNLKHHDACNCFK